MGEITESGDLTIHIQMDLLCIEAFWLIQYVEQRGFDKSEIWELRRFDGIE